MLVQSVRKQERSVTAALSSLQNLLGKHRDCPFAVRLWDGTSWSPTPELRPRFTLVLKHPGALRRMFLPSNALTLGEA
jgi:cyclopropane-fatty-acyl-phospholipid synthase